MRVLVFQTKSPKEISQRKCVIRRVIRRVRAPVLKHGLLKDRAARSSLQLRHRALQQNESMEFSGHDSPNLDLC